MEYEAPILRCYETLAIVPRQSKSLVSKVISLITAIVVITTLLTSAYLRLPLTNEPTTMYLIKYVITMWMVGLGYAHAALAMLSLLSWKSEKFSNLILQRVIIDDCFFKLQKTLVPKPRYVNVKFTLIILWLTFTVLFDYFMWKTPMKRLIFFDVAGEYLQYGYNYLIIVLECYILTQIRKRFEVVNLLIKQLENHIDERTQLVQVMTVAHIHNLLCDCCEGFNEIFGFLLFVHVISNNFSTLLGIVYIMDSTFVSSDIAFSTALWLLATLLLTFAITITCEDVTKQGKMVVGNVHKAMENAKGESLLKLSFLVQQANMRCPKFTAAGFFAMDYATLFTFGNLIATYVIVVIQLAYGKWK